MLAEAYHAMLWYLINNGAYVSWVVFSLLLAVFILVPTGLVSYYYRRKNKELKLGLQLVWYFVLVFAGWIGILIAEGIGLGYVFSIWKLALIGLVFYIPAWFVYNKIMERWPKLPWVLIQFFIVLVVSFIVWYLLLFFYRVFGIV